MGWRAFYELPGDSKSLQLFPISKVKHPAAAMGDSAQPVLHAGSLAKPVPQVLSARCHDQLSLALSAHTPGVQPCLYIVSTCWRSELG